MVLNEIVTATEVAIEVEIEDIEDPIEVTAIEVGVPLAIAHAEEAIDGSQTNLVAHEREVEALESAVDLAVLVGG